MYPEGDSVPMMNRMFLGLSLLLLAISGSAFAQDPPKLDVTKDGLFWGGNVVSCDTTRLGISQTMSDDKSCLILIVKVKEVKKDDKGGEITVPFEVAKGVNCNWMLYAGVKDGITTGKGEKSKFDLVFGRTVTIMMPYTP